MLDSSDNMPGLNPPCHLLDKAKIGLFKADTENCIIVDCNDITASLLKYSSKREVINTNISLENGLRECGQKFESGQFLQNSVKVLCGDGSSYWLLIRAEVDESGQFIVGFIEALNQSYNDKQEVEHLSKLLSGVFESVVDGIVFIDNDTKITQINQSISKIVGLEKEQILGHSFIDFVSQEDKEKVLTKYKEGMEGTSSEPYEISLLSADGEKIPIMVYTSTIYDNQHAGIGRVGIVKDLREFKSKELELKRSEILLNKALLISKSGLFDFDFSTMRWSSNNVLDEIFEIDENFDRTVEGWAEILLEEDRESTVQKLQQSMQPGSKPFDYDYRIKRFKSGQVAWMHGFGHLEVDDGGNPTHFIGFIQDITERKEAELEIIKQHDRLKLIIEGAKLGTWEWHIPSGEVVYSKLWTTMLGYDLDEIAPNVSIWEKLLYHEDKDEVVSVLSEHLEGKSEFYNTEHRLHHKDGSLVWVHDIGKVLERDEKGNPLRAAGIHIDITDSKNAEVKLAQSEKEYRLLAENATDMISRHNAKGIFTFVTPNCESITGYKQEELLGHSAFEFIHDDDIEPTVKSLEAITKKPITYAVNYRLRLKNGSYLWVEAASRVVRNEKDEIVEIIATTRNIEDRKKIEESLRQSEQRLSVAVKSANLGIWDYDIINDILNWDEGMYSLYEIDKDNSSLKFSDWKALIHKDDVVRLNDEVQTALKGEAKFDSQFRIVTPNGIIRFIRAYADLTFNQNGQPSRFTGVNYDVTERVNQEELVNKTSVKYKAMFEHSPVGISVTDKDGNLIETNPAAERFLGIPKDEHTNRTIDGDEWHIFKDDGTLFQPEEYASTIALKEQRLVEGIEMGIRHPDNSTAWLTVNAAPIPHPDYGVIISYSDISPLKESEQQLRAMFEDNHSVKIQIDAETGRIIRVNEAACQFYGYSKSELYNMKINQINIRSDKEIKNAMTEIIAGRSKPWLFEHKLASGEIRKVEVYSSPLMVKGKATVHSIIHDVTDREVALEALRSSEERLSLILDSFQDMLYTLDREQRYTAVYGPWLKKYNYTAEQHIGKTINDLLPPEHSKVHFEANAKALSGEYVVYDWKMPSGDMYRHFHTSLSPIKDENGNVTGVVGVGRDITERVELEEVRLEMERNLVELQKAESLSKLAGGVAHDFNNILVGVLGNTDFLFDYVPKDSEAIELINEIKESAERAADLARQMLAYSGKGRFLIKKVDINNLLIDMENFLKSLTERRVSINLDLTPELPSVAIDISQFQQIIQNLIINALEAIDSENGLINIRTRIIDYKGESELLGSKKHLKTKKYVDIIIQDNGKGISKEVVDRIFDPFFSTKFTGRGLGLAAAQGIMHGHNGAILFESEEGKGSKFHLLFCIAEADQEIEKKAISSRTREETLDISTILLVDDEEIVRNVVSKILAKLGYKVLIAQQGVEAVELYKKNSKSIDLVILDMMMPLLDGKQTFDQLKKIDKDVMVLMSSGYNEQEMIEQFKDQGPDAFIQKPFNIALLKKKLQEMLE